MAKRAKNDQKIKKTYQCPVCGYEFSWKEAEGCQKCFFGKLCKLIMCPRCRYEFPKA